MNLMDVLICEQEDCGQPATVQWFLKDEDGYFQTDRCDKHPVIDPHWGARDL